MKKILLFLVFVSCSIASALAQNNVQLIVNHKLGADDFALNQAVENNLGTPFQFNRFEYYIAEISITHDGGMVTQISDYWILVNAAFPTQEDLGDHMIPNVEKVSFLSKGDFLPPQMTNTTNKWLSENEKKLMQFGDWLKENAEPDSKVFVFGGDGIKEQVRVNGFQLLQV